MIGVFLNIRGLGQLGRISALTSRIRDNHVDFVGIMETKKDVFFSDGLLSSLTGNIPFSWCYLKSKGFAGGILVGANANIYTLRRCDILEFCVSVMLTNKSSSFSVKIVVVYGPPYEDGKQHFLDELDTVMLS